MDTTSNNGTPLPGDRQRIKPESDILSMILREADRALLANEPVVALECIRLAIREVNILKG